MSSSRYAHPPRDLLATLRHHEQSLLASNSMNASPPRLRSSADCEGPLSMPAEDSPIDGLSETLLTAVWASTTAAATVMDQRQIHHGQ